MIAVTVISRFIVPNDVQHGLSENFSFCPYYH